MSEPIQKKCPRCQQVFECKANDVSHCQCNQVTLTKETRAFLKTTAYSCLCSSCLNHFNELVCIAGSYTFPVPAGSLVEAVHYYMKDGNFVFTELYHYLKGYCCKNGCRHCVYGY